MAALPDEQAALLAAIVAEPDEDAPRLVYADWLQEHGDDEQAQFVRDSIALEWLSGYEDEERQRAAARLDAAAERNGPRWLAALGVTGADPVYDRGMVEAVHYAGADSFAADAPTLFARVPVRELTIGGVAARGAEPERDWLTVLAGMPALARLRGLWILNDWEPVAAEGWGRFITSPHLANLRSLAVQYAGLTDGDVLDLLRSEHLTNLEELDLAGNRLTAEGALTVVRSPRLPNLTRIGLAHNNIVEDRRRGSCTRTGSKKAATTSRRDSFATRSSWPAWGARGGGGRCWPSGSARPGTGAARSGWTASGWADGSRVSAAACRSG
ncbi:MAG: TIGR02996 domain-containing protein [Planctomycetes bacterium]|nr:TIGR02996 domain-containing protein [Planctomycetota bacterium]